MAELFFHVPRTNSYVAAFVGLIWFALWFCVFYFHQQRTTWREFQTTRTSRYISVIDAKVVWLGKGRAATPALIALVAGGAIALVTVAGAFIGKDNAQGAVVAAGVVGLNLGTVIEELALYRTLDNMPKLSVTTDAKGTKLYVRGTLVRGSGDAIAAAIREYPTLRVVQLSGPGGLLDEARIAGNAVKDRQLATFVATECDSACTLIFMSSPRRVLHRSASLGFHSPFMAPLTVANLFAYAAQMRTELIQLGATPNFAALASSVDSQTLWRPDAETLLANHVVTSLTDAMDWNGLSAN